MKTDAPDLPTPSRLPPGLAVLVLHSTDTPDLAVAGIRAAHAGVDELKVRRSPLLVLDAEGVRLAARGVLGALSTGGRPNLVAWIDQFVASGGSIQVIEPAWRDRGFKDDALIVGADLVAADQLARLAAAGYAIASY